MPALLVSALFRWPCSISIHLISHVMSLLLSPRFGACTAGVRPFPLAMQHFYSFVSQVISLLLSPRFGACTAGVRPFPLAMQHFHSFVSHVISLLLSPRFGACTAGASLAAFLFICLPSDVFTFPNRLLLGVLNAF